ncbi:MAG: cyclic nucleotide-binding domain-containing protein [Magnetococcales bacterium]|nr:cyclic nucleotide-binding domain-containing protein [Magnetococcales bacterium]NGZ06641.1 cyclic nucleotide-binding domain-containing protein [Magnetococcales bacterium]
MKGGRELGTRFQPGEVIFRQGEPARCMYVIQKGRVEIVMESEFGPRHLNSLKDGDIFGEISLFAEKARIATARAVTEVRALQLDEKTFLSRLHQDPSMAFRLIRKLAQRIHDQDHELMRDHAQEMETCPVSGFTSYIDLATFLEIEIRRARRLRQTMAFAILVVDNHVSLVEQWGEAAGEAVSRRLAEVVREHVRRTDVAGRFGADRFGVLLYEADGSSAVHVCEKVRAVFASQSFSAAGREFSATLTCGVAIFPEHQQSITLNQAAYRALMRGSTRGGNRVILAEPGLERVPTER